MHTLADNRPTLSTRLAVAIGVAVAAAVYVWAYARSNPDFVSDFDQVWAGARALLDGRDPYRVVGPRGAFLWKWPLYYPLPSLLIAAPLAMLPVVLARVVFASLSAGLFVYAISRDGFGRLPAVLSISFVTAIELVQWSPLLAAGAVLPAFGWLAVAKPNLGIAMAAAWTNRRAPIIAACGATLLVATSFAIQPGWLGEWWGNVRAAPHFVAPIMRPVGVLLLSVLLRWRRPEARLLAALACVPQTPTFYDHVLVFLVPRTSRESLVLVVLTFAVYFSVAFAGPFDTFEHWGNFVAKATMAFVYAPAVIMVLRRPNDGPMPAFIERLAGRFGLGRSPA